MLKINSISVVIPCLNEIETIEKVILNAKNACAQFSGINYEILVADNGSVDGTILLLKKQKGIRLIHVPIRGYGAALHYGILSARYNFVIFADADLSYNFMEIGKFIPKIEMGNNIVLGSRFKGQIDDGAMPFLNRYLGTPVLTFLINSIYHTKTTDCNSGMRFVDKKFYKKLIMKNSGMEWASELIIKTAIQGGIYSEVPIHFYKDGRRRKPHLKRWEDGWRHLKVIVLLKPTLFLWAAGIFMLVSALFVKSSLFTSIALFLIVEFLVMSFLITKKLESVIHNVRNPISIFIDKLPIVITGFILTLFGIVQLFLISDDHIYTKNIILFQMVLFDMWVFFIETIRTHLINPLPERI